MKTIIELIQESGRWYGGINPDRKRRGVRFLQEDGFLLELFRRWWKTKNKSSRRLDNLLHRRSLLFDGMKFPRLKS